MRILLVLLCSFAVLTGARAQAWRPADARKAPAPFLAGVAAGVLAHEVGHAIVATAKGYDIGLHGFSIVYPDAVMPAGDHLQVASAGFQTQWLLSEAILRDHEQHHAGETLAPFRAGVVVSETAVALAYLTVLKDHPEGDLVGVADATGMSTTELALLLAVPAALDYWRLSGTQVPAWVPRAAVGVKGAALAAIWTF